MCVGVGETVRQSGVRWTESSANRPQPCRRKFVWQRVNDASPSGKVEHDRHRCSALCGSGPHWYGSLSASGLGVCVCTCMYSTECVKYVCVCTVQYVGVESEMVCLCLHAFEWECVYTRACVCPSLPIEIPGASGFSRVFTRVCVCVLCLQQHRPVISGNEFSGHEYPMHGTRSTVAYCFDSPGGLICVIYTHAMLAVSL